MIRLGATGGLPAGAALAAALAASCQWHKAASGKLQTIRCVIDISIGQDYTSRRWIANDTETLYRYYRY